MVTSFASSSIGEQVAAAGWLPALTYLPTPEWMPSAARASLPCWLVSRACAAVGFGGGRV